MLINAISAVGNNSGIYPLLVRDCGIEVPTKVIQTYNQNKKDSPVIAKHAVRERSLDEIFPWDFIDIGVTKDFLKREWERAMNAEVTPNCTIMEFSIPCPCLCTEVGYRSLRVRNTLECPPCGLAP